VSEFSKYNRDVRPDRVLFPVNGFTVDDAVSYYRRVAKWMLPHLKNVPVSFKRFPETVRGDSFWEKDAPSFTPAWVKTFAVPRKSDESEIRYILIDDAKTLAWIAGVGGIEIHPFLHRIPRVERATAVVFDLDPGSGATFADCCDVALMLRDALSALKLKSFAKLSGSKGLQLYVPLNGDATHDVTESFARLVAEELARARPKRITAKMAKEQRRKKVFIDWSQNADYKTTVAVYSLRAKREEPFVSMPVTWDEVSDGEPIDVSPDDALKRLRKMGDLFAPVLKLKQKLPFGFQGRTGRRVPSRSIERALPKAKSQSGRRLFVLVKGDAGDELWLDMRGKFARWILRPDRGGGERLIAMPAGSFPIDPAYYRGEVPAEWRTRIRIEDIGSYEVIAGSPERRDLALWFSGKHLAGEWRLHKTTGEGHRSWRLEPRHDRIVQRLNRRGR